MRLLVVRAQAVRVQAVRLQAVRLQAVRVRAVRVRAVRVRAVRVRVRPAPRGQDLFPLAMEPLFPVQSSLLDGASKRSLWLRLQGKLDWPRAEPLLGFGRRALAFAELRTTRSSPPRKASELLASTPCCIPRLPVDIESTKGDPKQP